MIDETTTLCTKIVEAFFRRVDETPLLLQIYGKNHHCAMRGLTHYLVQLLGGSAEYSKHAYYVSLTEAHARFHIGQEVRDVWLGTMEAALQDVPMDTELRTALSGFFSIASTELINQPTASFTPSPPTLPQNTRLRELITKWHSQVCIDTMIAAVRSGDTDSVLGWLDSLPIQTVMQSDRTVCASLLGVIGCVDSAELQDYTYQYLVSCPALVTETYFSGSALLHSAAGSGAATFVKHLLELGANPNYGNSAGHTPLYFAGNGATLDNPHVEKAIHLLVQYGADVDAQGNIKQSTPLHAAARRGNLLAARALLDCGANLEAHDSEGDTPLRRAINCGKAEMVAFLLSRGADVHSIGSSGLEAWQAARTKRMKAVLQAYLAK